MSTTPNGPLRGRGSSTNPANRFELLSVAPDPDADPSELPAPRTQFFRDSAVTAINFNNSEDISFRASLNIYRGCEHGCTYCFARPFHEYLGYSSGLDFETKIFVKVEAPLLLRNELSSKKWTPQVVVLSGVTDCYQPAERHFRLTQECLKIFAEFKNPVSIITKSALVVRDIPILADLSKFNGIRVFVSITTLDANLARRMEPRASSPSARLRAIADLNAAGIPVGVMAAPMIPGLTDHELPSILSAARDAGARYAGYVVLRLPYAVKDIFQTWLDENEPGKKQRILDRVREFHGGRLYDSGWGRRMTGKGIFAQQLSRLFEVNCRRLGLMTEVGHLSVEAFRRPSGEQLTLF